MKVSFGQSILDIAIMAYGSVEGALSLAKDNDISLTQSLEAGQILQIEQPLIRPDLVQYFIDENFIINTQGDTTTKKEFNSDFNNDFA